MYYKTFSSFVATKLRNIRNKRSTNKSNATQSKIYFGIGNRISELNKKVRATRKTVATNNYKALERAQYTVSLRSY